ncbi:Bor family protein [Halomonas vilamensis]|uniref:Bor family protein n=1 Tax=Vreelandella vilamensis TaxID=531309 RepID=A0ABU1HA69_9GAMM|nr:Bor family protein [Halomonas vilamensis]MDR5900388.1 Bor family protein [Halomonas vilamensis]
MKKILLIALITMLSGCATQSYNINGGGSSTPDRETMQPFFVSGIGQTQHMNAAEVCGGAENVARVESHLSFVDGLLGTLTFGIFTPRQAKVYCTQ